jgi:exopolyphosphatase/guanosine-5'-triphosphate,3'-diphosphate pyrophosphatase
VAPEPNTVLAALDCGTNSTRLLIVSGDGATLTRLMRITRLGQGVDGTHRLDEEAMRRTLHVLAYYRQEMDRFGVGATRLVATSAVRDAANGNEFLAAATSVVGVPAELLSGLEEGRLSYVGAMADLEPIDADDVVIDIGGGSTEIALNGAVALEATSLDIGCVRITERYLSGDPPSDDQVAAAVNAIAAALDAAVASVPALGGLRNGSRLLGLAGTVSTLAMLEGGLEEYDRAKVHHAVLSADAVARWCDLLAEEDVGTRRRREAISPGREDVIFGGALVLREAMKRFGFRDCIVSESDILDGLVASIRS